MKQIRNPFITSGYISSEYFCDRRKESELLIQQLINGNNISLISPRRMGKTGLIMHSFSNREISDNYHTFFIDIYATKSLRDFVLSLSKVIIDKLKPLGKKAVEVFVKSVKSLQGGISFDISGVPSFNLQLGDIHDTHTTLDEIFKYLDAADKPCIIAIDEFQQIISYPEDNVEALLRTYIQHCNNANFIFAGSQRHIMGNIFLSPARPFYQSVSMLYLESIPKDEYITFAEGHFHNTNKKIDRDVISAIYNRFEGVTWYIQKMLNTLFMMTAKGERCTIELVDVALQNIIDSYRYNYQETVFRLPERQKEVLVTIAKEGKAQSVTGSSYVKKYKLVSASSVQAALKGLLEKDFVTSEQDVYYVYDRFFAIWLAENF